MKISYSWLKDYVKISLTPEKLAELLTNCGLEVESVDTISSIKGGLNGLIIGEVKEKTKHHNADKLSIAKVDIGQKDLLNIVCGAPNVKAGQKVIVAPAGTTIFPVEGEPFKIKEGNIRGEVSQGMICAEDEIGLGNEHEGIVVLGASAKVGLLAKEYFNVMEDIVFDIGLTPNRVDAASHIGVARDIIAVLNHKEKGELQLNMPSVDNFVVENTNLSIPVTVEDPTACPRYCGVSLTDIKVGPSPDWLSNRIKAIGLSPINNVVDATNFVLHETGQPLHAFDASQIKGSEIWVKTLKKGSKFVTLDGMTIKLSSEDLMICDKVDGMCIAGVFGGMNSGVGEHTTAIFLESAYFEPMGIRKTSKRHGLNTDSSFRFERGADPNVTLYALKRAAVMIKELTGGTISSDIADHYPGPIENFKVSFNYHNCNQLIGQALDQALVKNILASLDIAIDKETKDGLELSVPPYRVDVQREEDVIEEILRIYGYNNVSIKGDVRFPMMVNQKKEDGSKEMISQLLAAAGFTEIICNSITTTAYYEDENSLVKIMNPLNADLHAMRSSLLYGGLETVLRNQNHKQPDLKLFEFGYTYQAGSKPNDKDPGYKEIPGLAIFITGRKDPEGWMSYGSQTDYYLLKGVVNKLIEKLGIGKPGIEVESLALPELVGQTWKILNKEVALVGEVEKSVLKKMGIKNPVYYALFNWAEVTSLLGTNTVRYQSLPKYPEARRDLSLLLDEAVEYGQIEKLAHKTEKKLLKAVNLFDVYQGKNLPSGKKSYAVSFVFRSDKKTLEDMEIDAIMKDLMETYKKKLGAEIR